MTEMIGRVSSAISSANSQWEKENNRLALAGIEPQHRWGAEYLETLATAALLTIDAELSDKNQPA